MLKLRTYMYFCLSLGMTATQGGLYMTLLRFVIRNVCERKDLLQKTIRRMKERHTQQQTEGHVWKLQAER